MSEFGDVLAAYLDDQAGWRDEALAAHDNPHDAGAARYLREMASYVRGLPENHPTLRELEDLLFVDADVLMPGQEFEWALKSATWHVPRIGPDGQEVPFLDHERLLTELVVAARRDDAQDGEA